MATKKRLFEVFEHVTGIRIDESGLEYAHVDNAAPTQDTYTIGEEMNEINLPTNQGTKKLVMDLQVGDKLASGALIIAKPVAGLYTPKGSVEIGVQYSNGNRKTQIWNKRTQVLVVSSSNPV